MAEPTTRNGSSNVASAEAVEFASMLVRRAAAEVIRGDQSLDTVVRTVVADAVKTIEDRGPKFAEDAGILTWRYAVIGWVAWNVGKRVIKRKAKAAVGRDEDSSVPAKASA
jgi:hypothetical protein